MRTFVAVCFPDRCRIAHIFYAIFTPFLCGSAWKDMELYAADFSENACNSRLYRLLGRYKKL